MTTPEDPKEPTAPPQPGAGDDAPSGEQQTPEAERGLEAQSAPPSVEEIEPAAENPAEEPPPPPPPSTPDRVQLPPPTPPSPPRVERPAPPPPQAPAQAGAARGAPWIPIAIIAAIVVALIIGVFAWRSLSGGGSEQESTYVVQPYTPTTELITSRDRVEARAEPDASSRVVVIFGQGVTLNVSGRVQRGLGNDWYVVNWNNQTAFVRVQDVVPGSGAPPAPIVRERLPEEEEDKEEEKPDDELTEEEEQVVQAPSGGALGVGDVNWVREPSARDFARYFPNEALEEGQSGNVTLSCIIGGSGRLACSVASESPGGYGFGDAAIGISRQLRVRTTLPDGTSAEGREMRLPLSFRAN